MESRSQRTRRALQQAAMKRFVAEGVTERTFYRHFPSKHAVIYPDYDIGFEWFARVLALRRHGKPITASVRKAMDAFFFGFAMAREAAVIRSRDLDKGIITAHIRRMRDRVAEEIRGFIDERSALIADGAIIAGIAAHSLATAVFVALETWMAGDDHDVDDLGRLTDMALSALEEGLIHTLRHAGLD